VHRAARHHERRPTIVEDADATVSMQPPGPTGPAAIHYCRHESPAPRVSLGRAADPTTKGAAVPPLHGCQPGASDRNVIYSDEATGSSEDSVGGSPLRNCDMPSGRSIKERKRFRHVIIDRDEQCEPCTRHFLENRD
jgi:hypothetical protein